MSDPQRLLVGAAAGHLEREMLASWQGAKPSSAARERTLAMVGLGAGAAALTATTAAAGGSIAPKAAGMAGLAIAKWLAIGALLIGSTAATVGYVRSGGSGAPAVTSPAQHARPAVPVVPVAPAMPAEPAAAPSPTTAGPATAAAVPLSAAPIAAATKATPTEAPKTARPHAAPSSLSEQVALLDRARAALASGDSAESQRLVDEYASRFPNGAFAQEAEVLRIEALLKEGRRDAASRLATRFLSEHPMSPHAVRVRALLGGASP